jgi:putative acetyltransferase
MLSVRAEVSTDRSAIRHVHTLVSNLSTIEAIGLAPMAVLPAYQRQGVGSQLVQTGLATCGKMGYGIVVVLGHPHF